MTGTPVGTSDFTVSGSDALNCQRTVYMRHTLLLLVDSLYKHTDGEPVDYLVHGGPSDDD